MLLKTRRCTLDIEANGLLDDSTIDYTTSPYKIKESFKLWCIVCIDIDTDEVFTFEKEEIYTKFFQFKNQIGTVIAHNGINYDLLAMKLCLGIDYHIPYDLEDKAMWDGREVNIIDTMVLSKTLNPDRFGGHSLDEWGKRLGYHKIDWRAEAIKLGLILHDAPKGAEFQQYHPAMTEYCIRDNEVTKLTYLRLMQEWGDWPFAQAFCTEQKVADIITRQSHRGFDFKKSVAENALRDLDEKIENIRVKVEPVLPSKRLPKTKLKEYTPTTKQFNKDSSFSANMVKFVNKHGGEFLDDNKVKLYGVIYDTPMPVEPIVTDVPSTLKDTTHIKEWLVGLGWEPSQFKERDLTVDQKKKKLTAEKFELVVDKYVTQTLNSSFCPFRCEHIKTTPEKLKEKLMKHDMSKPLKVLTNPTFTIGQEKEIDPMLERMVDIFPYTQDLVEYLTYNHRRNSILGGGYDPDEDDEEDFEKGFLANIRADGRIPTPADSCGTGTSRMKHKICANIPRVTSLYGDVMRSLFGVTSGFIQIGYDFSSLEARIEAHYTWKYDPSSTKEYCNSLTLEKPHDVHSRTSEKISKMINKEFSRGNAKSVKYACVPVDNTEVLTTEGWKKYSELSVGERIYNFSLTQGCLVTDNILDLPFYENAVVFDFDKIEATEDHKWLVEVSHDVYGYKSSNKVTEEDSVVIGFDSVGGTYQKSGIKMGEISRRTDVFCLTTNNGNFVMRQNGMMILTGNCSYGAQAAKLMKTIGCDMKTAELVFAAFWEAAKPLAMLKENLTKYWETTGQRAFILGLDKRRIPTRSKHALVNSLFQSAGVIVAKKAMILHEQMLRTEGLYVDFFMDDWKNKAFCQQLIAYHK